MPSTESVIVLPQVKIKWGRDFSYERDSVKTYVFENEDQKAFFLKGIEEGCGWLHYEIQE